MTLRFGLSAIKDNWGIPNLEYSLKTLEIIQSQENYETKYEVHFFNMLRNIAYLYLENKEFSKAEEYILKANTFIEYSENQSLKTLSYFTLAQYEFEVKNYQKVKEYVPLVDTSFLDNGELAIYHTLIGDTQWALNEKDLAYQSYLVVDSLYVNEQVLNLALPYVYQNLINQSIEYGLIDDQLDFSDKLIKVNNEINTNTKYLNNRIYLDDSMKVQELVKNEGLLRLNGTGLYIIILLVFILFLFLIFTNRQFLAKALSTTYVQAFVIDEKSKRAPVEIEQITPSKNAVQEKKISKKLNISQDVVDHILHELHLFEEQKLFLNYGRLKEVADLIQTNSSYLSKVVNFHKEKSFTNYIHELRIMESAYQLKIDPILQSFTIDAISREFGYNNAESFSKAFKKYLGKYPSQYIKDVA